MKKIVTVFLFSFNLIFICGMNAQKSRTKVHELTPEEVKTIKKEAGSYFDATNYNDALKSYLKIYSSDPNNTEYNFRIGYCYLETTVNKKAASEYLVKACESKNAKKEWLYYLGQASMYSEEWDQAEKAFDDYKSAVHGKPNKDFINPDRMIEMCRNGKDLCANPVKCVFKNVGKSINTSGDEFNPFVSADGSYMVFTSRRKGNTGGLIEELGFYTADVYWSQWKDTAWLKAKNAGVNVNTEWDDESVGLSPMGDQLCIFFDDEEAFADLKFSMLKGKMWQRGEPPPAFVNSIQYEGSACTSLDGNTMIFSSNRKESIGGSDLFMIKRIKNNTWSEPVNLGNSINTIYDEDSPFLSLDGKKLYFSSKGWNSMGGFDIFCSEWNPTEQKWNLPQNIGFPVNDAEDNNFISFTGDERYAYLDAIRQDGFGERDIYKVEFLDSVTHPFNTLITGNFTAANGRIEIKKISLESTASSEVMELYPLTSYHFAFAVKPGKYLLKAEGNGFTPFSEEINITSSVTPLDFTRSIEAKASH
jgi:tetratricopeptide (TPR) repeat protein